MGFLSRLLGKSKTDSKQTAQLELEKHEGFFIRPAPLKQNGNYVTAGYIYLDSEDGERQEHYFIRADTHSSFDAACDHAKFKAKQIIREQGDRLFARR